MANDTNESARGHKKKYLLAPSTTFHCPTRAFSLQRAFVGPWDLSAAPQSLRCGKAAPQLHFVQDLHVRDVLAHNQVVTLQAPSTCGDGRCRASTCVLVSQSNDAVLRRACHPH